MGSRKPLIGTRQVQYSLTCLRIPLQARLQFSPHSQSLHGFRNSKGRPEAALHLCGTPPSGAAPAIPFGGWIAVFAKIRSPAKSAASSGLWRQPTLFGIHIVPVALTGQLSSLRLETSNDGEGKKSLPRADDLCPGGARLRPWANQSDVAPRATIPANTGGGTLPASPRFLSC
jgi:hypothetical protein